MASIVNINSSTERTIHSKSAMNHLIIPSNIKNTNSSKWPSMIKMIRSTAISNTSHITMLREEE